MGIATWQTMLVAAEMGVLSTRHCHLAAGRLTCRYPATADKKQEATIGRLSSPFPLSCLQERCNLQIQSDHGSSPPLLRISSLSRDRCSSCRQWRSLAVRDVSTPLCPSCEQDEVEDKVPEREVRAGSQGRQRRPGRVAEPRGHAGLRRGGRRGAHHRERRASEHWPDRAAAGGGAGAHRRGQRLHSLPHLPIRVTGLMA